VPCPSRSPSPAGVHRGLTHPAALTCDGDNISPPLGWSGVPAGTAEVALVVDDPDAPRGTYVHWIVVGLDPVNTTLAEATVPPGVRQVRNSAGKAAYTGPCPPGGPAHHYRFTIYALQRPPTSATRPAPRRRSRPSRRSPPPAGGWLAPTAAERTRVGLSSYRARPTARLPLVGMPGFEPHPARPVTSSSVRRCMPDLEDYHRRVLRGPDVCAPSVSNV
jgi:Raf kinase inhibitor-like YbhB/YbcL family protein